VAVKARHPQAVAGGRVEWVSPYRTPLPSRHILRTRCGIRGCRHRGWGSSTFCLLHFTTYLLTLPTTALLLHTPFHTKFACCHICAAEGLSERFWHAGAGGISYTIPYLPLLPPALPFTCLRILRAPLYRLCATQNLPLRLRRTGMLPVCTCA